MKSHCKIRVQGKVQGVFYRVSARQVAEQLGIFGFVQNETSGEVYIEAEADEEILERFVEWCRKGPSGANVIKVEVIRGTLKNFYKFDVNR